MIEPERGEALRSAVFELGLLSGDLWISYVGLGGDLTLAEVESFLVGMSALSAGDYDRLAQVANEKFMDLGRGGPVPYAEDIEARPGA